MDSSHFTWLCFLLLTFAAPHPNIAMPSDHSAGGTQDSSAGRTNVTVYHCKDCESNVCKSSNYEDFVKIGETQSATFSDETIHLVTSETEIIMCIQQKNTFPEGIYAIVWEKAMGIGDSCGTLNSGASSENVRGNSIKICCNAQINLSVPNPPLNCNAEMSGIPRISIDEKSSVGIITPVLILRICAAALAMYCV